MSTSCCLILCPKRTEIGLCPTNKYFLTGLFLSPQSYPTKRIPGHFLPDVCPEIHPLLWRPETFRLTHQLFISNQVEIARRRGTRKLRTYQSGIKEEHVLRGKGRGNRTYVLLLLEDYINNLSGTDGHRTFGRHLPMCP